MPRINRLLAPLLTSLVSGALLVACGGDSSAPSATGTGTGSTFALSLASGDLSVAGPQRVQVGIFGSDPQQGVELLTSGSIELTLAPYQGGEGSPVDGTATYLPAPGTAGDASGTPALTPPDVGRGVYELPDVRFDAAGLWQAQTTVTIEGEPVTLSATFPVAETPALPAPGDRALRTKNLTIDTPGASLSSIDSRAMDGAPIPDPELHMTTIAEAIDAHRPALVLFATPVYCQSRFCGPSVEALETIAAAGPPNVDYIHVEIWNDYQKSVVNRAAADWLLRGGDLTEPWLFLIDRHGVIVDRWGPLFDPAQVQDELDRVAR